MSYNGVIKLIKGRLTETDNVTTLGSSKDVLLLCIQVTASASNGVQRDSRWHPSSE